MAIPFMSTQDAASSLGVSAQRIRTLLREGVLAGQQVGKTWVVDSETVSQYVDKKVGGNLSDRLGKIKSKKSVKALSFFSGAMGLDLGLEKAGIEVILACEKDKKCRETILANKPDIALIGNIVNYTPDEIVKHTGLENDEIDLMVGGPPCQTFSTAGNRGGFNDERGDSFLRYLDSILNIRPKYAVIENVRGLLSAPLKHRPHSERGVDKEALSSDELRGGALKYIIDLLEGNGYGVSFNLYNAANFGVPQIRERVVIICNRDGEKVPYLNPTNSNDPAFGLPPWMTLKDAISDLDDSSAEHIVFPDSRLKYYKMLKSGEYWKHLPVELQKEALGKSYYSGGGKTGFLRRLAWEKPSCTLLTHPAMPATDICHPTQDRPLSIQEYKRIQQFPDDAILCGSIIDRYKQIGNAVPIGLGEAIGKAIINHLNKESIIPPKEFPFSRYKNTDDVRWKYQYDIANHQQ
jgi:DNA (cytosine-5)-methyltransferase 1